MSVVMHMWSASGHFWSAGEVTVRGKREMDFNSGSEMNFNNLTMLNLYE